MKRIIIVLFVLLGSIETFAQKSYLLVREDGCDVYLSGDVPSDMKSSYSYGTAAYAIKTGELLNELAKRGFEIESMCGAGKGYFSTTFLLSKKSSGGYSSIQTISNDEEGEVTEIARYNLQGMPVKENEKGLQIIVYSNYTTKTVVVQ